MHNNISNFSEENISEYKSAVEYMAENNKKLIFANPSAQHASIVLSTMIKHADANVFIYDQDLSGDVINLNDEFIPNLKNFLDAGKKITFILENKHLIAQKLVDVFSDKNVKIIEADNRFKETVKSKLGNNFYFAIADKSKFRIESSENNRKAFCSFNNSEYPEILIEILKENKIIS